MMFTFVSVLESRQRILELLERKTRPGLEGVKVYQRKSPSAKVLVEITAFMRSQGYLLDSSNDCFEVTGLNSTVS
jgi:hypothetical protein